MANWKIIAFTLILVSAESVRTSNCEMISDFDLTFDEPQQLKDNSLLQKQSIVPQASNSGEGGDEDIRDEYAVEKVDGVEILPIEVNQEHELISTQIHNSHRDVNEETGSWLLGKVNRIRRQISKILSLTKPKENILRNLKKISYKAKANGKTAKLQKLIKLKERRPKRQLNDDDEDEEEEDEDEDEDVEISGSGDDFFKLYRLKVVITNEPWRLELRNPQSPEFLSLAADIKRALKLLYEEASSERIDVNVVEISQTKDTFKVLVTVDITGGSAFDGPQLDNLIRQKLASYKLSEKIGAEVDNQYSFKKMDGFVNSNAYELTASNRPADGSMGSATSASDIDTLLALTNNLFPSVENDGRLPQVNDASLIPPEIFNLLGEVFSRARDGDEAADIFLDGLNVTVRYALPPKENFYADGTLQDFIDNYDPSSPDVVAFKQLYYQRRNSDIDGRPADYAPINDEYIRRLGDTFFPLARNGDEALEMIFNHINETSKYQVPPKETLLPFPVLEALRNHFDQQIFALRRNQTFDVVDEDNTVPTIREIQCASFQFQCDNKQECIHSKQRCDQSYDCNDFSDERNCDVDDASDEECSPLQFTCDNGQCINQDLQCNGIVNCDDQSDEDACPAHTDNNYTPYTSASWNTTESSTIGSGNGAFSPDWQFVSSNLPFAETTEIPRGLGGKAEQPAAIRCRDPSSLYTCPEPYGTTSICSEQICDGYKDCPGGQDEYACADIACLSNEFSCDFRRCLPISERCNGIRDCADATDEIGCAAAYVCRDDEFQCKNGLCIPESFKCNQIPDCSDAEDEDNCKMDCKWYEHRCSDGTKCIHKDQKCDGTADCTSAEDEKYCEKACLYDKWQCDDGTCISVDLKCNGNIDCPNDVSDERQCSDPKVGNGQCGLDQWPCADGQCINREFLCDDNADCFDASDEGSVCSDFGGLTQDDCDYDNEFFCDHSCHPNAVFCNGSVDCLDGTDEANCLNTRPGPLYPPQPQDCPELQCPNGKCFRYAEKCDGTRDCDDASDERDCCTSAQFKCNDGTCVDRNAICNNVRDCPDGSDEQSCPLLPQGCRESEWRCENGQCVSLYARCDGTVDCLDTTDERNCNMSKPCGLKMFRCENGPCIPDTLRCNGRIDCPFDSSDEIDCHWSLNGNTQTEARPDIRPDGPISPDFQLNLRTYPSEQTIKESREVVFRCRDEGPARARVRWVRPNGQPLPPSFNDLNGRLEIPNIRVEDAGEYICEAVGYPQQTYGQHVTVRLNVERYNPLIDRPTTACGYHEATCMNGECIAKDQICNGVPNCADGSDEHSCSNVNGCEPNQFKCRNSKCVDRVWRCDGENDCGDNSDEESCDPNPTGSPCRYDEFQCSSGQCIPKTFHCDATPDCLDRSDEIGCREPEVIQPPVPSVNIPIGGLLNITCRATGTPLPVIVWRLNWGHVPQKCRSNNQNGFGNLICSDMQTRDSGAYSCEIINTKGRVFVTPDTIVTVISDEPEEVCPAGFFNALASRREECINCFCFNVSSSCRSANLFVYMLPPAINAKSVVGVELRTGNDEIRINGDIQDAPLMSLGHGVQFRATDVTYGREAPYLSLPAEFKGNQLKSYGGFLKYELRVLGGGQVTGDPDIILVGNDYVLSYRSDRQIALNNLNLISAQFVPGSWYISDERKASREEIMMALVNVEHILIRLSYTDDTEREVEVTHINMDSAGFDDRGLGSASLIEQCQCPEGYAGLSCEACVPGYVRERGGAWLGRCVPEPPERCPSGTYGDPSRGVVCRRCPCPSSNSQNNFAHSCSLGADNDIICHCNSGYTGRRCERCEPDFEGDPMQPGGGCRPRPTSYCNPLGTIRTRADGTCECKAQVAGLYCDQCYPNSFNLNDFTDSGCSECFCMGVTESCASSNWFRDTISSRSIGLGPINNGFSLISDYESPQQASQEIYQRNDEIRFRGRSDDTEVLYWSLPVAFLGDKISSYGGSLNYSNRYSPLPGGLMSKNNAPDVVIKSNNDIVIVHYRKGEVLPGALQQYTIPIVEREWQRADGHTVNREYLLMALADVSAIYIKATYTTVTQEAALGDVSLDIATENNSNRIRAFEVEQCVCPIGYEGLSCEDCAIGYKRSEGGLYLGICELCECNGHSEECEPESGICLNCRDNTAGDFCDKCAPGFTGNATSGYAYACQASEDNRLCQNCDIKGTLSCPNGYCLCKPNVVGNKCDYCAEGAFNLQESNPFGCSECYCSGISSQCSSSSYSRDEIPFFVYSNKPTLTDYEGVTQINDGFQENIELNEISHFFYTNNKYFWSLPALFLGNQIKSYGGSLKFVLDCLGYGEYVPDQDVIIRGNGITIVWSRSPGTEENRDVEMRLHETGGWQRLERSGLQQTNRDDILTVLSNIDHILIRATLKSPTTETRISNIVLETAVENRIPGRQTAVDVEVCRCPPGYSGSSCETCDVSYYRDTRDRYGSFGSCKPCPCSNNADNCHSEANGQVLCICRRGYYGAQCQYYRGDATESPPTIYPPVPAQKPEVTITVTIDSPLIRIIEVGEEIELDCTGRVILTQIPIDVSWYKLNGQLPPYSRQDQGRLLIQKIQTTDRGIYICQAVQNGEIARQNVTIHVGRPQAPVVSVTPSVLQGEEYQELEAYCSCSGFPEPTITWQRLNGPLPQGVYADGPLLRFTSLLLSHEGSYRCLAENPIATANGSLTVYVQTSQPPQPPTIAPVPGELVILPNPFYGNEGNEIRLTCQLRTGEEVQYSWLKDGSPLRRPANMDKNWLVIRRSQEEDSGMYECQSQNIRDGRKQIAYALVVIYPSSGNSGSSESPPKINSNKEQFNIVQGQNLSVDCEAIGSPTPAVHWTRLHGALDSNVEPIGRTLKVTNAQPANRGVYLCLATNSLGGDQYSITIDVEPRERPEVVLSPQGPQNIQVGETFRLACIPTGIPQPKVTWERFDRRSLSPRVWQENGYISIEEVTLEDSGQYECRAENVAGVATTIAVLNVQQAPQLRIYPSQPVVQLQEGDHLSLSCVGSGFPIPIVQWQDNQILPPNSRSLSGSIESEAKLEIYRITSADARQYICEGSNELGSERAVIDVRVVPRRGDTDVNDYTTPSYPPTWPPDSQQQNVRTETYRVGLGEKATLTCTIDEGVQTTWDRIDGFPIPRNTILTGSSLIIEDVGYDAVGIYQCSLIDRNGRVPLMNAEILVVPIPRITFSPAMPMVVQSGGNVDIHCNASGEPPIRVEWHAENHRPLPPTVIVSGPYLRFSRITPNDAGRYYCSASNYHGNATKVAEVLVNRGAVPNTSGQSQLYEVSEGDNVVLGCNVTYLPGQQGIKYNWVRSGEEIPPSALYEHEKLVLRNVRRENDGRYICEILSPNDGVIARNFVDVKIKQNEIKEPFGFLPSLKLSPPSAVIKEGDFTEVECTSSNGTSANIIWGRADGARLPTNVKQIGNRLVVSYAQQSDGGEYVCKCVTDKGQVYTTRYRLEVEPESSSLRRPVRASKIEHAEIGSTVILHCNTDNYPDSLEWKRQHGKFSPGLDLKSRDLRLRNVQANDAGTYICSALINGEYIDLPTTLVVTGAIPYFPQAPNSFMKFQKLENAFMQFSFEITFKPEQPNGLILFNGQKKGSGDFISVSLNDRYPEFRFDFGKGPVTIKSEEPITLRQWHTVKVNRIRKDGYMIVDTQRPVAFPPWLPFAGLDLLDNLYLGGVANWDDIPSSAYTQQKGFVGCISRLVLSDRTIELNQEVLYKEGTTACEPCADDPCQNDGVCLESQTEMGYSCICEEGFTGRNCSIHGDSCTPDVCGVGRCADTEFGMTCYCPVNRTGSHCQYVEYLEGKSLRFKNGSYAAYKTPKANKLNIKFRIHPKNLNDSVVLYVAEADQANGDFAAVVIKDHHLELRIHLGARLEPIIIKSLNPLKVNQWTDVRISRKSGESYLQVGNEPQQTGKASGEGRSMYLKTNLYIGGFDKRILLNKGVGVSQGFDGCISKLEESGRIVDMVQEIIDAANVLSCGDNKDNDLEPTNLPKDACESDPCANGGTCRLNGTSYTCECPLFYYGKQCETRIHLDMGAKFKGNGYLEINHSALSENVDQLESFIAIQFNTDSPNGLIMWYGQESDQPYNGQDFLALAVVEGILEFSFRLDGEESSIRAPEKRVDDGNTHLAVMSQTENQFTLALDRITNRGESRPTSRKNMHLPGHIFLGGTANSGAFTGNRYSDGFNGCVKAIESEEGLTVNLTKAAISGRNVGKCHEIDDELRYDTEGPVV